MSAIQLGHRQRCPRLAGLAGGVGAWPFGRGGGEPGAGSDPGSLLSGRERCARGSRRGGRDHRVGGGSRRGRRGRHEPQRRGGGRHLGRGGRGCPRCHLRWHGSPAHPARVVRRSDRSGPCRLGGLRRGTHRCARCLGHHFLGCRAGRRGLQHRAGAAVARCANRCLLAGRGRRSSHRLGGRWRLGLRRRRVSRRRLAPCRGRTRRHVRHHRRCAIVEHAVAADDLQQPQRNGADRRRRGERKPPALGARCLGNGRLGMARPRTDLAPGRGEDRGVERRRRLFVGRRRPRRVEARIAGHRVVVATVGHWKSPKRSPSWARSFASA